MSFFFLRRKKNCTIMHAEDSDGDHCALHGEAECDKMTEEGKQVAQFNDEVTFKMKKCVFTSYDELPLLLDMKQLSNLLGGSDTSVYELIQEVTRWQTEKSVPGTTSGTTGKWSM